MCQCNLVSAALLTTLAALLMGCVWELSSSGSSYVSASPVIKVRRDQATKRLEKRSQLASASQRAVVRTKRVRRSVNDEEQIEEELPTPQVLDTGLEFMVDFDNVSLLLYGTPTQEHYTFVIILRVSATAEVITRDCITELYETHNIRLQKTLTTFSSLIVYFHSAPRPQWNCHLDTLF